MAWCDRLRLALHPVTQADYVRHRSQVIFEEQIMKVRTLRAARLLFVTCSLTLLGSTISASPYGADHKSARCAAQFERAQRMDMESFRDYDAETFRAVHHPDAVTIFASGDAFYGVDAIMGALASHFKNREAIWAWTEVYRLVDGCRSAFILYDATYTIPSIGYHQRTLTGVTYTYSKKRWLAIADQGTYLEAPAL